MKNNDFPEIKITRRLGNKEWAELIKKSIDKNELRKRLEARKRWETFGKKMRVLFPLTLFIGIISMILMYVIYGGFELVKTILSWTIGATVISTFVPSFIQRIRKII